MTEYFGRWRIVGDAGLKMHSGKRRRFMVCVCECGTQREVMLSSLRAGQTSSCGCLKVEAARSIGDRSRTHGKSRGDRLYGIWCGIRRRCLVPGDTTNFHRYGGRGIGVAEEWSDFQVFERWALANGYCESLQIDRIDNANGYTPDNCRWVTSKANQRNRTNNRVVEYAGRSGCVAEWAEWLGVSYHTLYSKIARGVPMSQIVGRQA